MSLPSFSEVHEPLPLDQFTKIKNEFLSEQKPKPQTLFNFAWALIRQHSKQDQKQGLFLFHELYREYPARRRECFYYISLAEFKLGNYKNSRKYIDDLLSIEPNNTSALELKRYIESTIQKDGFIGLAIVTSAVAAVGVAAALLFKK